MQEIKKPPVDAKPKNWGKENYLFPRGAGFIEADEMKCVGCGLCQHACSMQHFGVLNNELSRIQVRKYLLPLPKAVQGTCVQCGDAERECEKACPISPSAIYFDKNTQHMVVNQETCISCLQCQEACSARAVRYYPEKQESVFVCDLCDVDNSGNINPQCINVCPYTALHFIKSAEARFDYDFHDLTRKHADDKADLIAKRLYPLPRNSAGFPGWR